MSQRSVPGTELWVEAGGEGGPTLLLLHGLGATGEVWRGLVDLLPERWPGRWVVPDLRGHGRSGRAARYSFGHHAADAAALLDPSDPVVVLGHSMGGVVGLALASGWYGPAVTAAVGLGIKVSWSAVELEQVRTRVERPVRRFQHPEEAAARFLRVAGLEGLAYPGSALAASGVARDGDGYYLATDPRAALVGAPPMGSLLAASRARVLLARGAGDHMVTLQQLRELTPDAVELPTLGHNAHVENPERVLDLVEEVTPV